MRVLHYLFNPKIDLPVLLGQPGGWSPLACFIHCKSAGFERLHLLYKVADSAHLKVLQDYIDETSAFFSRRYSALPTTVTRSEERLVNYFAEMGSSLVESFEHYIYLDSVELFTRIQLHAYVTGRNFVLLPAMVRKNTANEPWPGVVTLYRRDFTGELSFNAEYKQEGLLVPDAAVQVIEPLTPPERVNAPGLPLHLSSLYTVQNSVGDFASKPGAGGSVANEKAAVTQVPSSVADALAAAGYALAPSGLADTDNSHSTGSQAGAEPEKKQPPLAAQADLPEDASLERSLDVPARTAGTASSPHADISTGAGVKTPVHFFDEHLNDPLVEQGEATFASASTLHPRATSGDIFNNVPGGAAPAAPADITVNEPETTSDEALHSLEDTLRAKLSSDNKLEISRAVEFLKTGIQTRNAAFNRMMEELSVVALNSSAPVLLLGPTGAGKSQLARRIFKLKKAVGQLQGGFVELNCAAVQGALAQSTLFGHTRGAFTGASNVREGLLRKADKGLLFLDEIGALGLEEQALVLKAIEDKRFYALGADRESSSNFQLICGTNQNLQMDVLNGKFREDLFSRCNVWTFVLPGLADRSEDILPNLEFELSKISTEQARQVRMETAAKERFLSFACAPGSLWRGNFRDFSACIQRMSTFATDDIITLQFVEREIERLRALWSVPGSAASINPAPPATKEQPASTFARVPAELQRGNLYCSEHTQRAEEMSDSEAIMGLAGGVATAQKYASLGTDKPQMALGMNADLGLAATSGQSDIYGCTSEADSLFNRRTFPNIFKTLGEHKLLDIDLFDRPQLEFVLGVCYSSKSLAEAGRSLFQVSRVTRSSSNDSDRLRKYLARFGISWSHIHSQQL